MILLWLPFTLMLLNRGICWFLGINSATLCSATVQRYLPEAYRSSANAFQEAFVSVAGSLLAIIIRAMGEIIEYRLANSLVSLITLIVCWISIRGKRKEIKCYYV